MTVPPRRRDVVALAAFLVAAAVFLFLDFVRLLDGAVFRRK